MGFIMDSLNNNTEVILLDLQIAFNIVWYNELVYKLIQLRAPDWNYQT